MSEEVLIKVEGVSKKFCRRLRRSLWYGLQDTVNDLLGRDSSTQELRREEFWAVNDISFELRRGECLGLIGRNGAGKTTLLKMLSGLIKPDRGRIEMRGRVGALIALGAGFNPVLTGRENIYVNGAVLGLSRKEIDRKIDSIIEFADIGDFIDAPVQSYSSGMVVRLGFAVAVAVEPDILLLDEVLAVGDVTFQAKCLNALAEFRKRGTCFVFVSHNMHMIYRYCQKVMYFAHGQVQHFGRVDEGIAKFLRDTETGTFEDSVYEPDWSRILGSGKIVLSGARFLDANNEEVNEIAAGDPFTLALQYERRDTSAASAILDVAIRDREQIVYRCTNALAGTAFDDFRDRGELRIQFACQPVNSAYIDFSVALLDEATGEVFDWKRNVRLTIRRSARHSGRLVLPATWTMTALEPTHR
jgi:lipopolysaccharide transport system ATP-binding protein